MAWLVRGKPAVVDDLDVFDADGALTAEYLLARGYCCGLGCTNCPYIPKHGGDAARAPASATGPEAQAERLESN